MGSAAGLCHPAGTQHGFLLSSSVWKNNKHPSMTNKEPAAGTATLWAETPPGTSDKPRATLSILSGGKSNKPV